MLNKKNRNITEDAIFLLRKEDFQHYQAVKENKGFCLVQDLFTMKESDDKCDCGEFNHE